MQARKHQSDKRAINRETSTDTEFWWDTYGERSVANINDQGRWLAYLGHALQKEIFATAEDAAAWLTQRLERGGLPARSTERSYLLWLGGTEHPFCRSSSDRKRA
jgi:hypothetical protein